MEGHGTSRDSGDGGFGLSRRVPDTSLPDSVLRTVTEELVSRIAQKLPARPTTNGAGLLVPAPPEELDAYCDALISPDPARSGQFFDQLRAAGKTPDTLALSWNAEAARRLGERWVADTCGFLEVTLGLSRLHGLQRRIQSAFVPDSIYQPPELSALFAPAPGETHMLGVTMAADFFRRAGWRVDLHGEPDLESLCRRAKSGDYRLVGLSAGCLAVRGGVEMAVQSLRQTLPDVKIVLGGFITELEPNIKEQVNVDHVFSESVTASLLCQKLVFPELECAGIQGL